jgi:nitroimidazol reductase NimA-like FMN-containing flavoprotein (pyridoxamine 5'-phosphate oxidase superfamily)
MAMIKQTGEPKFRDLTREQAIGILARNQVGRLAFSFHDAVDIRPIHYVYDNGWIFGRTSVSDKLVTLRHNQWVAFEVDEIESQFNWVSVVVRGSFYPADPGGDSSFYGRAVSQVRRINPRAFTDDDPTAFRTEVWAIHIDSITGKSSTVEE